MSEEKEDYEVELFSKGYLIFLVIQTALCVGIAQWLLKLGITWPF